ncbi:MAG: hypothetical protein ACOCYV_03225 [Planctomycetota bacterium]
MIRAAARLPIALRVPLMGVGMMLLVGLVASQQVLSALTRTQEARLAELTRQHVDGLSIALGPSVLQEDVWAVFDTLDRASRSGEDRRMVLTVVADPEGRIIAATDPRRAPIDGLLSDLVDLDAVPGLDAITLGAGDGHVRVLAPLVYQGREVGRILTELDVSDLTAERAGGDPPGHGARHTRPAPCRGPARGVSLGSVAPAREFGARTRARSRGLARIDGAKTGSTGPIERNRFLLRTFRRPA